MPPRTPLARLCTLIAELENHYNSVHNEDCEDWRLITLQYCIGFAILQVTMLFLA